MYRPPYMRFRFIFQAARLIGKTRNQLMVIQTHGRNGQYNPHLHIIATSGGWDQQTKQWVYLDTYQPCRGCQEEPR